ncbi:phospholipase D family protein [Neisseria lisongii]|uniref:Phospholipase D family protein n=1 Tax=Neisseria lisongii TaxID=2912188 RepID=A0AAW5AFI1_9NEIS|nr:phospholipase D family protein [Neisseria lisongii]MCF7528867.1 phospholipase D family protein [Neisseria lisongii]
MKKYSSRSLIYTAVCTGLTACASLPSLEGRSESSYLKIDSAPRLDGVLNAYRQNSQNSGKSGIYLLNDAHEAFLARAALIESADYTLDLQYYIWHNDYSGKMLFNLLHRAAERGVRVRLLLDDNNTNGLDNVLLALDNHPNIEIRLFNPFTNRKWRALGYLTDFPRLNRRMHNKSLTADNRATIVGGRNIGDEYFKVHQDTVFADLDILAVGRVVGEVSEDFDRYWASGSSYPAADIIKKGNIEQGIQELEYSVQEKKDILERYRQELQASDLFRSLQNNSIKWFDAQTELISDDPAKGLNRSRHQEPLGERLFAALQKPEKSLYLVSPYFVPTRSGVETLSELAKEGVAVTVLTNSLQATDVAAVHSGYAKYRKPLLQSGIELYELKPNHAVPKTKDRGLTGNSATSLHAKTFIVDQKRVFIGSFNLDPRSERLNTEMGVVIESPKIAGIMYRTLANTTPDYAYKVTLDQNRRLHWQHPDDKKHYTTEPEAGFWKRVTAKILSYLPIEGLL